MPDASAPLRYIAPKAAFGLYESADGPRPDIFLITVDMIPPEAHRLDGYRPLLRLPALDRLQADSVTFTNAFCVSPLCGPSRATLLTGRYSYMTVNEERAHDGHEFALRRDDIIFPEYLRAAGYATRHVGKCHVGAAKFLDAFGENDHPWDRWAPPVHDDDEYHQYLESLGVRGWRALREIRGARADGAPGNLYGEWLAQEDGSDFPQEATYSHFLAVRAARTLRTLRRNTARGRPIYLQLDFFAPHQPFAIPAGMEARERELRGAIRLPDSFIKLQRDGFRPPQGEPKIYSTYRKELGLCREDLMREYILANLLQIESLDRALGVFLDALREEGVYQDALILFAADHGEMNGERALADKGVYGHPKVARVPLVIHGGGASPRGLEIAAPVSLLDLAPTVLSRAGIRPHARLDGGDLGSALAGSEFHHSQDFLFETGWHLAPNPAVSIQHRFPDGRHFFYTYNLADRCDELYDLRDGRFANLAGVPEHEAARREMLRRLADIVRADPRWRCYWHALRADHGDAVDSGAGDHQMFQPE